MKRAITLLILILGLAAKAQVKVDGNIVDAKGKPVAGASITLKDTYDGATTDSVGRFSFLTTEKGII
jgi:vitamin B12 transporter